MNAGGRQREKEDHRGLVVAACVLAASVFLAPGAESAHTPGDSLVVRVICDDYIGLTLRDPSARSAFCAWDSTTSMIPGCRAFSMVEIYDEMGYEDELEEEADSVEADSSDAARTEADVKDGLETGAVDGPFNASGARRFVVLAPQAGEWTLEARVPANVGYVAATLWLDVRLAPNGGASHVAFTKWAELKPCGRVQSKLRVGRDGSVMLVGTVTRGEFVWPAAKGRKP